ncbi:MAG TPA: energy-coupling factor ABC transporter permease [Firmicutes bacterium]|nr:energy-coupling factor ABC transporter permease [Bacillota bacterium]
MHIPDGFLDTKTWVTTAALSAVALGYAVRKTRDELGERQIPALGVLAAFVFAAQMVNFPIVGGTSGHLLGAVLAAVLLGPWSASIIITTVLAVQALFFQDGGITALGANVLNMGVIGVAVGYGIYRLVYGITPNRTGRLVATFIASWASVVAASLAASVELAASGVLPFRVVAAAMLFWHVIIGLGEGVITTAVVAYFADRLVSWSPAANPSVKG